MNNLMKLVVALEEANVTAKLDTEGAMYALEGLMTLQDKGWDFIPPPSEASSQ